MPSPFGRVAGAKRRSGEVAVQPGTMFALSANSYRLSTSLIRFCSKIVSLIRPVNGAPSPKGKAWVLPHQCVKQRFIEQLVLHLQIGRVRESVICDQSSCVLSAATGRQTAIYRAIKGGSLICPHPEYFSSGAVVPCFFKIDMIQ